VVFSVLFRGKKQAQKVAFSGGQKWVFFGVEKGGLKTHKISG